MPGDGSADELAIRALTAAYTDAINRADVEDAVRAYASDATFVMMDRPTVTGRDGIAEVLRSTVARYQLIVQLLHSGVVQVGQDRAQARWQITEYQIPHEGRPRLVVGRYEDEHVRQPDGWRFSQRVFTARYLGDPDLTGPVLPDRPPVFPLWGD